MGSNDLVNIDENSGTCPVPQPTASPVSQPTSCYSNSDCPESYPLCSTCLGRRLDYYLLCLVHLYARESRGSVCERSKSEIPGGPIIGLFTSDLNGMKIRNWT